MKKQTNPPINFFSGSGDVMPKTVAFTQLFRHFQESANQNLNNFLIEVTRRSACLEGLNNSAPLSAVRYGQLCTRQKSKILFFREFKC